MTLDVVTQGTGLLINQIIRWIVNNHSYEWFSWRASWLFTLDHQIPLRSFFLSNLLNLFLLSSEHLPFRGMNRQDLTLSFFLIFSCWINQTNQKKIKAAMECMLQFWRSLGNYSFCCNVHCIEEIYSEHSLCFSNKNTSYGL